MNTSVGRRVAGLSLLAAAAALAACAAQPSGDGGANPRTLASVQLSSAAGGEPQPNPQSPVQGTLNFSQVRDVVSVNGTLTGLKPNARHAFHVHEKGDCSAVDASSAGPHFNPFTSVHGRANAGDHHSGDMDNVVSNAEGVVQLNVHLAGVTLGGGSVNDIAGRALVVHAAADDYTSQPAGNAGARVACGVITVTQ